MNQIHLKWFRYQMSQMQCIIKFESDKLYSRSITLIHRYNSLIWMNHMSKINSISDKSDELWIKQVKWNTFWISQMNHVTHESDKSELNIFGLNFTSQMNFVSYESGDFVYRMKLISNLIVWIQWILYQMNDELNTTN